MLAHSPHLFCLLLLPSAILAQGWYPATLTPPTGFMTFYRTFDDYSYASMTTSNSITITLPSYLTTNSYQVVYGLVSLITSFNNARFQTVINRKTNTSIVLNYKIQVMVYGSRSVAYTFLVITNSYMASKCDHLINSNSSRIDLVSTVGSTNVSISLFQQSVWRKRNSTYYPYFYFPSYFNMSVLSFNSTSVNVTFKNYTYIDSMRISCLVIDLSAIPSTIVLSVVLTKFWTSSQTSISTGVNLTKFSTHFMGMFEFKYSIAHSPTLTDFSTTICTSMENVGMKVLFFANVMCPNGTTLNLDNPQQPKCNCPDGTQVNGQSCVSCHFSCSNCINTTASSCTSCSDGTNRVLTSNSCVCLAGYYETNTSVCPACNENLKCLTCINGTACTTCDTSMFRQLSLITNSCECPQGRFNDVSTDICLLCAVRCRTCVSQTTCTACAMTSNRNLLNDCNCMQGYFDNGTAVCPRCNDTCLSCEVTASNCTQCNPLHNRQLVNGACHCLAAHYNNDPSQVQCYPCSNGCQFCSNGDNCTTCYPNYYKNGTICELSNNITTDIMLGLPNLNENCLLFAFSEPVKFAPDIQSSISLQINGSSLQYTVSTPTNSQYSVLKLLFNKTILGSPLILTIAPATVLSLQGSKVLYEPKQFQINDYYNYTPPEVVGMRQITGAVAVVAEGSQYGRSTLMVPGVIFVLTDLLEFIQIISYCIFLDIDLPANVKLLLECFYEASSLNFLPQTVEPPIPQNPPLKRPFLYEFYDFNYSFLYDNFVGISAMFSYTIGFVILWLISFNQRKNKILSAIRNHYRRTLYANLSGNYLTCFLPLGFAAVVCLRNTAYRTWMEAATYGGAWTFLFLCIVVLFMHPVTLKSTKNSQLIDTTESYGQVSRQCRNAEQYIFSRLLLLMTIILTIPLCSPMTSLILMFLCSIYHLRCCLRVTFLNKKKKVLRVIYISIHMLVLLFFIVFTAKEHFSMSAQEVAYLGYATIGLILINLAIETFTILWEIIQFFYTAVQNCIRNYRKKRIIKIKDPKGFHNLRQKRKQQNAELKLEQSEVIETKYPLATTRDMPGKSIVSPAVTPRNKTIKKVKANTFDLVQYAENYH